MKRVTNAGRFLLGLLATVYIVVIPVGDLFAQTCVAPPNGIISWWPFDETTDTTANDIIGNHPGVHVNGPVPTQGQVGNALRFDGQNDFVGVGDSDDWAFGENDFTVELWANFDVRGGGSIVHAGDVFVAHNDGGGSRNKWFFALGGGLLNLTVFNTAAPPPNFYVARGPFQPVVGQWYHLAVTKTGTMFQTYVNGVQVGSEISNSPISNPNAPLVIGQSGEAFGGFMNGLLDEVTVYNRALSDGELLSIANAGSEGKCKGLTISTRQISAVQLGQFSMQELKAEFGEAPISWDIVAGNLPLGMTLSSEGVLSGTPTDAGEFPFTVRATDSNGDTAEKMFSLDVLLVLPPSDIRIQKSGTVPVPGRTLDYFILLENVGNTKVQNVEVTELLEPWFEFVSADPMPTSIIKSLDSFPLSEAQPENDYDALVKWGLGSLEPGQTKILTYKVVLDRTLPLGTPVLGLACSFPDKPDSCDSDLTRCLAQSIIICERVSIPESECLKNNFLSCFQVWASCGNGNLSRNSSQSSFTIPDDCSGDEKETQAPIDPNEKVVVAKRFIQPDQLLVYPIHFENIGDVEALDVFITDVLDPNLDLSSLELLTPEGASFDQSIRTIKWDLLGRNLQPAETDNVLLSIRPKPGLPSGTEIRNKADIQFEIFDIFTTNEVINIIDSTRPACTVASLPSETPALEFPISWSGTDAVGEIANYSILVSEDGSDFSPLVERTSETMTLFTGESGKTYGFLCVAEDTAGNIELQEPVAEATTRVNLPAMVSVPTVVELDRIIAEDVLTTAGLTVGNVTEEFSDTVVKGAVIRQEPLPGAEVKAGDPVDLVISLGPELVVVPDVKGKDQASAEQEIGDAGLMVGNIIRESSSSVPEGSVIRQTPAEGASVGPGSRVDLVVSSGPPSVSVRDLNADGCVDRSDYAILIADIRDGEPNNPAYDFNGDGSVNRADARTLVGLFTNPRGAPCN